MTWRIFSRRPSLDPPPGVQSSRGVPAFRSSEDADKQDRISALGTPTGKGHGDVRLQIDCNVDALAGFALAAAGGAVTSQAARGRSM